jgi:phenylacetate-CoA ligase
MIWNRAAETLPREQLRELQLTRLRETVDRQLRAVPVMGERLRASGVTSATDISSLDDVRRLPFSQKSDLRDSYPFGLFAVPREEVVRVHASSGTRGKPTVVGYTRNDLAVWSEVMARCLALAGVRPGMVVHNAYGYGLFTGGLGFHQGAELMGCTVIPVSGGMSQRQVMLLQDLGGEVLCCTPSYALSLAQAIREQGLDRRSLRLTIGCFGAEPWTEPMRDEIERQLGIQAINFYGLSEIVGPGVSAECAEARQGAHIHEDHFLPEIVDPATGELLSDGEEGELVLTTLTKEALPLLRYRTGDLTSLTHAPCACGRTTARMARVRNRVDDMLIIRGVNLYPSEIERILLSIEGLSPHYLIVVDRPAALDELTILIEPASDDVDASQLPARAAKRFHEGTGLHARIEARSRGGVPRSEGKAVRVIDRRPPA